MNDFWRIYRLLHTRRYLIIAMMLIAGTVIFLGASLQGQKKEYRSEARLQPQDVSLPVVLNSSNRDPNAAAGQDQQRILSNVSDLIMVLRSSNDLYRRVAGLLRMTEQERSKQVQRILEKNGFFAPSDADIESQAVRLVAAKELTAAQADQWVATNKKMLRERTVATLTQARDELGPFAAGGVKLSDDEIIERIREYMSFDTVNGPLSTENTTQVVNQIKVSGTFERAAEADLYVNLICVAFIDFYTNQAAGAANARIALLKASQAQWNQKLQRARNAEVAFKRAHGVIQTADQSTAIAQAVAYENKRNELAQVVKGAEASVAALEVEVGRAQSVTTSVLPISENPQVRALETRVAEAQINFDRVRASNAGEELEIYRVAKAELEAARRGLQKARSQTFTQSTANQNVDLLKARLAEARMRRDEAANQLNTITEQIVQQKAQIADLPQAQARLADLRRDVLSAERALTSIETTLDAEQMANIRTGRAGTISIVSQAHSELIGGDINKQRGKLMAYGMVLALLFGIAMVIGLDAVDNTVRTPDDVEKLIGLPVAGILPAHYPDPLRAPRVTYLEPLSPIAEAYRLLRTDLFFTAAERPFKSLMTATGKPGQGATTTITNLAITFAQAGKKVILVDADLRAPKLHSAFRVSNDRGLSTLLSSRRPIDDATLDATLQPTDVDNLYLLTAGPFPLNPTDLLGSDRMKVLHERLKERADYVLFDTPSAIAFADSSILASFLDATLMVVRSENVPRGSEEQVRAMLTKARANLIGVVLNGVPADRVDSVHYHYQYYGALPSGAAGVGKGPNGNGSGYNGYAGGPYPLALPPGQDEEEEGEAGALPVSTGTATSTSRIDHGGNGSSGGNAAAVAYAAPATATDDITETVELPPRPAPSYGPISQVPTPRMSLKEVPWKLVLLMVVGGLVLGALVLMLASGSTVK